ncbi:MAG: Uma2 family endonuclease [Bryobacterales bacterium]|nr:Uma2 family endonuclease [Bryobacterales bacterium]
MAVKTGMTEEEYLRTSFPGVDQEFRDGELVERAMPDTGHSTAQVNFIYFFEALRRQAGLPFYSRPELRHRLRAGRYLIPDVAVYWPERPAAKVPDAPPLIAIEILSPDDRMGDALSKLREYVDWGVPQVWFIDPDARQLAIFDRTGSLRRVPHFGVPHTERRLTASDLFD